jgi:hypothetical protein
MTIPRLAPVMLPVLLILFAAPAAHGQPAVERLLDQVDEPVALAASPDASRIAVAGPTYVEVYDAEGILMQSFGYGGMPDGCCVADMAFFGNDLLVARGGQGAMMDDGPGLTLWPADASTPTDLPAGNCVDLDTSGDLAISSCDGAVQIWAPAVQQDPVAVIHDRPAEAVAIDAQREIAALADMNTGQPGATAPQTIRVFNLADLSSGRPPQSIEVDVHSADIMDLAFLPSGHILSLDSNGVVLTSAPNGTTTEVTSEGPAPGNEIAVSPDGALIAGDFRQGMVIEVATGTYVAHPATMPMQGGGLWAFLADRVIAWTGQPPTYPGAVLRVFAPDGGGGNGSEGGGKG